MAMLKTDTSHTYMPVLTWCKAQLLANNFSFIGTKSSAAHSPPCSIDAYLQAAQCAVGATSQLYHTILTATRWSRNLCIITWDNELDCHNTMGIIRCECRHRDTICAFASRSIFCFAREPLQHLPHLHNTTLSNFLE